MAARCRKARAMAPLAAKAAASKIKRLASAWHQKGSNHLEARKGEENIGSANESVAKINMKAK